MGIGNPASLEHIKTLLTIDMQQKHEIFCLITQQDPRKFQIPHSRLRIEGSKNKIAHTREALSRTLCVDVVQLKIIFTIIFNALYSPTNVFLFLNNLRQPLPDIVVDTKLVLYGNKNLPNEANSQIFQLVCSYIVSTK